MIVTIVVVVDPVCCVALDKYFETASTPGLKLHLSCSHVQMTCKITESSNNRVNPSFAQFYIYIKERNCKTEGEWHKQDVKEFLNKMKN